MHLQHAGIQFLGHPLQISNQAAELCYCPGDVKYSGYLCWHALQLVWPLLREVIQLTLGLELVFHISLQPVGPTGYLKLQKREPLRFTCQTALSWPFSLSASE